MNYKYLILFLLLLTSCTTNVTNKSSYILENKVKFSSSGFVLVYDNNLFLNKIVNKKMNDRDLIIFQRNLKTGTSIKILNPVNNKSLIAQVGKNSIYPIFNNAVVSKRIASELELNINEPYLLIEEIVHNSSFIAKKSKTFDEEKKVANKAPVENIIINDLNVNTKIKKLTKKKKFNYSIKIADFYFSKSAINMKNKILNESSISNVNVKEISKNKFRVILGPYLDLKSLKNEYNKLHKFNFENIEIIKNV